MKYRTAIAFSLLWTMAACSGSTQTSFEDTISQEIASLREDVRFQSVSGALYLNGERLTFHYGALDNGVMPSDNTLFEIGSLTKTYTGLLLAQAVHDGKVNLDDAVTDYVAEISSAIFTKNGRSATIRDLASHTSGLPVSLACHNSELAPSDRLECYKNYDRNQFYTELARTSLLDTPGAEYRYSNAGIRLLSHIIEDAYSMSYPELLEAFVFERSGEADTLFRLGPGDLARLAVGKNEQGEIMPNASEYYFGAGALKTTTASFLDHMAFYFESDAPILDLATTLIAGESDGLGRAYVWNTFRYSTEGMLYHAGGTFGTSSWVALYPKESMGIFLVTPLASPSAQQSLNDVSNQIIDKLRAELTKRR